MSDVYSNQQVAELLGIKEGTLRTWKARKSEQIQENTHWVKSSDGGTLWTETGVEMLRHLCNGGVSTTETASFQPETDDPTDLTIRYTPIIETVSDAIANQILSRIDATVTGRVKQHLTKPVSTLERVSLLSQLGLKPANPELLLQGNNTNYLPQGDNENGDHV